MIRSIVLFLVLISVVFGGTNHRRKSSAHLRRLSKNRHILAIDRDGEETCSCGDRSPSSRQCPCTAQPLHDVKDSSYSIGTTDVIDPNYSVITSSGQVMDGFSSGDIPVTNVKDSPENDSPSPTTSASTRVSGATSTTSGETTVTDDSAASAATEWTILPNGTNITGYTIPRDPPAGFVPVTTGGAIAPIAITDQTLLTVYKGNDASDRPGVLEFGDVFGDFHNGWSTWPTNEIKFLFDDGVSNCVQTIFHIAVSVINENSCVQVSQLPIAPHVEDSIATPILHITEYNPGDSSSADPSPVRPGCSASLGYINQVGGNEIHFAPGCLNTGTAIHLLLHALGMFHEHQRPDRDNYINIVSNNFDLNRLGGSASSVKLNAVFGKVENRTDAPAMSPWMESVMKRDYDYGSIMHNGPCHYAVNEDLGGSSVSGCSLQPTLVGSPQSGKKYMGNPTQIGNRLTMSRGDKMTLNDLYKCPMPGGDFSTPDPADVASVEGTRCTILDSADFSWSSRANTIMSSSGEHTAVSSTNIKLSADSNTGTSNEQSTFKDYLRDAAQKKLIIILGCVLGGILVVAIVGIYWWFKKRKSGTRDAVLRTGDSDDITKALRDEGNGEGTDEEVIDELIERDHQAPSAPSTAAR